MFKSLDLSLIVEFILMFYRDKPIDWLLDHILWVKVCNPEKDAVSKGSTKGGEGQGEARSLQHGLTQETAKLGPQISLSLCRSTVTGRRPTCGSASSHPSSSTWARTPHWLARSRN